MAKPMIDARQAVEDIRSGLDDAALMKKHNLSAKGLHSLMRKLVLAGVLTQAEYDARVSGYAHTVRIDLSSYRDLVENHRAPEEGKLKCVLAITDDNRMRERVQEIMEKDDLRVSCFSERPPSVARLREILPDLVVADARSSGLSCLDLIRRVNEFDDSVPVILLTDPSNREESFQAVEQGAHSFVEMPLEMDALRQAVSRGLERGDLMRFKRDQQKLMEQAIHEKTLDIIRTKDFLKGMLNSSSLVSVVLTDLDQKVLFWNKGAEHIFGYTANEIIGDSVTKLYPPDAFTKETVEQLRKMIKEKKGTVLGKMEQLAKDGRVLTMSLALSPMVDQTGELQGILGIGLDVTEEVRQQQQILMLLNLVKKTQEVSIFALAKLAESRDEETGLHLTRIQEYCKILGLSLAKRDRFKAIISDQFIEDLYQSCVLHDIGKVGIPDSVLLSNNSFTEEDREIMKRHPIIGGRALEEAVKILGERSFLTIGMEVAYFHHERWDGAGYPFGLEGETIPLSARIVALADVYDALTSERRYKRAFTHEAATRIVTEGSGKHFDPDVVEAFQELENEFSNIRSAFSSPGPG